MNKGKRFYAANTDSTAISSDMLGWGGCDGNTVTGTGTGNLYITSYECPHRLPCGYCMLMSRQCAKNVQTTLNGPYYTTSHIEVTC